MSETNDKGTTVLEMPLDKITIPTLVVANSDDRCTVTLLSGAKKIAKLLTNAKTVKVKMFSGGREKQKNPCRAETYHGFLNIEDEVVDYIANFIKSN